MQTADSSPQSIRRRRFQRAGAITTELFIEGFETMDQVGEVFARVHAAGGFAEVGAAAKRTMRIDSAAAISAQQRAGTVWMRLKLGATAGADAFRQIQSLAEGEERGFAGEAEMAAAAAELAVAGQGTALDFGVDGLDLRCKRGGFRTGIGSAGHGEGGMNRRWPGAHHFCGVDN